MLAGTEQRTYMLLIHGGGVHRTLRWGGGKGGWLKFKFALLILLGVEAICMRSRDEWMVYKEMVLAMGSLNKTPM